MTAAFFLSMPPRPYARASTTRLLPTVLGEHVTTWQQKVTRLVNYAGTNTPKVLLYIYDKRSNLLQQLQPWAPNSTLHTPEFFSAPLLVSHCIYAIFAFSPTNTTTKVYIGQTSKCIRRRFIEHVRNMLRKRVYYVYSHSDITYTGRKLSLHAAMAEYGPFEFMILPLQLIPQPFRPSTFRSIANRFETLWMLHFFTHRPGGLNNIWPFSPQPRTGYAPYSTSSRRTVPTLPAAWGSPCTYRPTQGDRCSYRSALHGPSLSGARCATACASAWFTALPTGQSTIGQSSTT
jgi:hypothetical protein